MINRCAVFMFAIRALLCFNSGIEGNGGMKTRSGYLFKRNGSWTCQAFDNNGKRVTRVLRNPDSTPCQTKAEAEAAKIEFMKPFYAKDQAEGLAVLAARIQKSRNTVAQHEDAAQPPTAVKAAWTAFMAYLDAPKRRIPGQRTVSPGPATLPMYENIFIQFRDWLAEKYPAAKLMRDVTPEIADAYAGHLHKRKLGPNRYNKHRNFLTMLFRVLAKPAKMTGNPFEELAVKENPGGSYHRELTVEELKAVTDTATGEIRVLFAIGIYTGLRLGDCATLRWAETDLIARRIKRIPRKTSRRRKEAIEIPIHPILLSLLTAIPDRASAGYVLPATATQYLKDPIPLVKKIQAHFSSCGIRTVQPGTGVEIVKGQDGKTVKRDTGKHPVVEVGFHSLRHTFVSLARMQNTALSVVEGLVGHSSPAMTRHYTHTSFNASRDAIDGLPDVTAEKKDSQALPVAQEAMPAWIRVKLTAMDAENWQAIRDELVKQMDTPTGS